MPNVSQEFSLFQEGVVPDSLYFSVQVDYRDQPEDQVVPLKMPRDQGPWVISPMYPESLVDHRYPEKKAGKKGHHSGEGDYPSQAWRGTPTPPFKQGDKNRNFRNTLVNMAKHTSL